MPLRKLTIDIELSPSSTGQRGKEEHARILRSILALLENPNWSAFSLHLHDTHGNHVGRALLCSGARQSKELPIGDSPKLAREDPGLRSGHPRAACG